MGSFPQISMGVGNMMTRLVFLFAVLSISSCATIERGSRFLGGVRYPRTVEDPTTTEEPTTTQGPTTPEEPATSTTEKPTTTADPTEGTTEAISSANVIVSFSLSMVILCV